VFGHSAITPFLGGNPLNDDVYFAKETHVHRGIFQKQLHIDSSSLNDQVSCAKETHVCRTFSQKPNLSICRCEANSHLQKTHSLPVREQSTGCPICRCEANSQSWMRSKFTSARSAHWNLQISTHSHVVCHVQITPHQKLPRDGVLTPVPLFCLICTIISNKTGIFEQYQNTPQVLAARSFLAAGFDTLVILRSFSCILQTYSPLQIVTISTYSHLQMPYSGMYLFAQETHVRRVLLQQQIQIYYYSHLQIVRIRQTQKQCYTYASA